MMVYGLDIDVGVEGVIEENRATCVMSHVEPTSTPPISPQSVFRMRLLFHVGGPGFQL